MVDPHRSVFLDCRRTGDRTLTSEHAPRVERIGRPRAEPLFRRAVVARMLRALDAASVARVRLLERALGRLCGPSTGTKLVCVLKLMCDVRASSEHGSVVALICDGGGRSLDTCFDDRWLTEHGYDVEPHLATLEEAFNSGRWLSHTG